MSKIQRIAHCSHWGAYTLLVDDGRIQGIEPFAGDPAPSAIIHSVKHWLESKHRIAQPMVRTSWLKARGPGERRGDGEFVPVSWEQAFKLVASEIDRVRSTYGNRAIFAGSYGWTSCGRFHHAPSQLKRLLNLVGGYTGHVDTYSLAAGPSILRHVMGSADACSGESNTLDSIAEHTQTLLIFGALSPRTAQSEAGGLGAHQLEAHLRRLVKRKVNIVLVSPTRDDLPDWVPAQWWPIRPNTDTALMLGLTGELLAANAHDKAFLNRCCSGADEFLRYVDGTQDGIVKNAAWAQGITGLDAGPIQALARQMSRTRSMITVSWSLQRADHGEQPFWAGLALASVLGQMGMPGGGIGYGYGSLGGVGEPVSLIKSPALPQLQKPNADFIPVARISDLLLHPGEPFSHEGKTFQYPDTRLVYWAGGNPFHHHQDLNRLRRAWARPETIIVQDPMWTATARRADIVLPACTSLERNDLAGNRRSAFLFAMQQAVSPLAQSLPDYDILHGIADALGVAPAFTEGRDEMAWVRLLYNTCREDAQLRLQHALPDFEEFWHAGFTALPSRTQHTYLQAFRADPQAHPLKTQTGRIVLWSKALAELALLDCPAHPSWLEPAEWLGQTSTAVPAALHLISRQPAGKLHSQLDDADLSMSLKGKGREALSINPVDAVNRGIRQGDVVRVWNQRGQCLAVAMLTDGLRPGVVILPTGAWYDPQDESPMALELAGNPNVLTRDKGSSSFGQGCAAHTALVFVEPCTLAIGAKPSLHAEPNSTPPQPTHLHPIAQ